MTPGKFLVLMGGTRALEGVPIILGKSAIPFIGLSSGSVAANGAISGITALPTTYASAYCWFPANALATVKAAGWYYCTFSSTTAGTAFLDTYTSGIPTIPGSPTPVTDGKGAFLGDTGEEFGPAITVPANSMGPNGALRITTLFANNNSGGTKTLRHRFSGNAGTVFYVFSPTTTTSSFEQSFIWNRGATNAQVGSPNANQQAGGWGAAAAALPYGNVDTTAQTTVVLSEQRNTATDNMVLESFMVELLADGT